DGAAVGPRGDPAAELPVGAAAVRRGQRGGEGVGLTRPASSVSSGGSASGGSASGVPLAGPKDDRAGGTDGRRVDRLAGRPTQAGFGRGGGVSKHRDPGEGGLWPLAVLAGLMLLVLAYGVG